MRVVGADQHRVVAAVLRDVLDQRADPLLHFARGAAGEGDHHHLAPGHAAPDQVRHLVHDRRGLSRARPGQHDHMFLRGKGDFLLAGIEGDASLRNFVIGHGRTEWACLKDRARSR